MSVDYLDIGYNRLSEESLKLIVQNPSIKSLNVSGNDITADKAKILVKMLSLTNEPCNNYLDWVHHLFTRQPNDLCTYDV